MQISWLAALHRISQHIANSTFARHKVHDIPMKIVSRPVYSAFVADYIPGTYLDSNHRTEGGHWEAIGPGCITTSTNVTVNNSPTEKKEKT